MYFKINDFSSIYLNAAIIVALLFLMYLSSSLMVYILNFFLIIVNLGLIMYSLKLEFLSLWLLIIYGGSIIMFIIIISTLCRTEFNFFIFKKSFVKQLLTDLIILGSFSLYLWNFLNFNAYFIYQNSIYIIWKSFLHYSLFIIHYKLVIWIAILLMMIMIFVVELQEYMRIK